jgi:hypothetical protein
MVLDKAEKAVIENRKKVLTFAAELERLNARIAEEEKRATPQGSEREEEGGVLKDE